MALAETAVLAVELKLAGASQFKAGISEADAAAAGLGKSVTTAGTAVTSTGSVFSQFGGRMGFAKQAIVSTGQAIGGMASHFKNVITGPLGLIGLGAGLFTVAGAIKSGIDQAQSFGLEVQKLAALTGQSVEATSAMAAALDHFGISGDAAIKTVGMLTKNIGMVVNSKGGTQKFFADYGLQLRDTKGNLVSVNEEILRTADYFNNKSIPATEKAAGIAKLYGRSWQALIPFLQAGRKGITEAEQAAQDLGLTLTAQNVGDLKTYRESFLKLGDAVKGAELQIGLVLMPALSGLATSVTNFLAHGGRQTLVTFFQNALQTAKDFGAFVSGTVIPTIKGLASAALGLWNSIPAPLRDILAKGFIADRTIHFLFGVSPLNLAKNLLGDIIGPVLGRLGGSLFQRGGSPATPLFVADVTGGLGGGAGAAGGGAGGIAGALGGLGLIGALGLGAIGAGISKAVSDFTNQQFADKGIQTNFVGPGSAGDNPLLAALPFGIGGAIQDISEFLRISTAKLSTPQPVTIIGPDIEKLRGGIGDALAKSEAAAKELHDAILADRKARNVTNAHPNANPAIRALLTMEHQLKFLTGHHTGAQDVAVAHDLTLGFEHGIGSPKDITKAIKELQADQKTVGARDAAIIGGYIDRLKVALKAAQDKNKTATDQLTTAARHDAETSASIAGSIRNMKPPSVAIAIAIGGVALSQTVIHRHATVHRYGPTGGTRNTSLRQSESFG
jgi:hypothetical protein